MSSDLEPLQEYPIVRSIVRRRKTTKVFAAPSHPATLSDEQADRGDAVLRQCIEDAGFAPFHFDRRIDGIAEPWRIYWLRRRACRAVGRRLVEWFGELKPGNKMPGLLSACGSVVLATWIPQTPAEGEDAAKLVNTNEEHLAATAAWVQNLLILLEANHMPAYWSSGGLFKSATAFERLGIPLDQRLIACVYIYYGDPAVAGLETAEGGQRAKRSPASRWSREVHIE